MIIDMFNKYTMRGKYRHVTKIDLTVTGTISVYIFFSSLYFCEFKYIFLTSLIQIKL